MYVSMAKHIIMLETNIAKIAKKTTILLDGHNVSIVFLSYQNL